MIKELPIIIDTHVHFRIPGADKKEDWIHGTQAALHGGVGVVFDMPNNVPSCDSIEKMKEKVKIINQQIKESNYPLNYKLYLGATNNNLAEITNIKNDPDLKDIVCGIKVFMGSSTGSLLVDKEDDEKKVFLAAKNAGLVVAVHAENEEIIKKNMELYQGQEDCSVHSKIRNNQAAAVAVERAIKLTREVGNKLLVCHASTKEELALIKQAKDEGLSVYAEACPHHLYFTEKDYKKLGNKIKMNPPVRSQSDVDAMWVALNDGTIDILGTDHAPHTLDEKNQSVWKAPSGVPGIETLVPFMLNAVNQGKISFDKLADLMHNNAAKLFNLQNLNGKILVDMDLQKEVIESELKTKCAWSPFVGVKFKGWPIIVILNNKEYNC